MATLTKQIGKTNFEFQSLRGEVAGASKWSTTHVSGGGGGGYVHQGTGYSATAPVTSTTTEHDQFFVRRSDGKETPMRLSDAKLALRDGQDVSLVWGIPAGKNEGAYVAVMNHTTGQLTPLHKGIGQICKLSGAEFSQIALWSIIIAAGFGLLILFNISKILGVAGIAGLLYWGNLRNQKHWQRVELINEAVKQLI